MKQPRTVQSAQTPRNCLSNVNYGKQPPRVIGRVQPCLYRGTVRMMLNVLEYNGI